MVMSRFADCLAPVLLSCSLLVGSGSHTHTHTAYMRLKEEKKILKEIDELKKSKKLVAQFSGKLVAQFSVVCSRCIPYRSL